MSIIKFGNNNVIPTVPVDKKVYGTTAEAFVGKTNANGVLQMPNTNYDVVFDGVTDLVEYALYFKFYNAGIKSISFPDLVGSQNGNNGKYSMNSLCNKSTVQSASFPKLEYVKYYGMNAAFRNSNIRTLDISKVKKVDDYGMNYICTDCSNLTGDLDLSKIETAGTYAFNYGFQNCVGLTSVDLSKLENLPTYGLFHGFEGCTNLTSVNLGSLNTYGRYALTSAFNNCVNLSSVDLSGLTTITETMSNCFAVSRSNSEIANKLKSVSFTNLSSILPSSAFYDCFEYRTGLEHIYFPALNSNSFGTNTLQFTGMLFGVTGCTVHFPANLESVIGSWESVINGFNGTNTTVLFDLPATT